MIVYKANENGFAIDENGNQIPTVEGKPRLFNGTVVLEFDNYEEYQKYIAENLAE